MFIEACARGLLLWFESIRVQGILPTALAYCSSTNNPKGCNAVDCTCLEFFFVQGLELPRDIKETL